MQSIATHLLPTIAAFALSALASTVHAGDEKNPAVEACAGKAEGAPCVTKRVVQDSSGAAAPKDEPGTCQPDQCCELDYSQGSPPKSNCGPCLACKPGPPTVGSGGEGGSGSHGEPPRGDDGGPPATEPSKKGCAIGGTSLGGASLVLLMVVGLRRRSR